MGNLETVQQIYAAFGRGDVAAIVDRLAADVEWEHTEVSTDVPWLQPRRGRAEVPKFFESLDALAFHRFEPKTLLESGNVVVSLIDIDLTVKATGKRILEKDEVHIWHFNPRGEVTRFCHKADTYLHWAAYRGGPVSGPTAPRTRTGAGPAGC